MKGFKIVTVVVVLAGSFMFQWPELQPIGFVMITLGFINLTGVSKRSQPGLFELYLKRKRLEQEAKIKKLRGY